MKIDDVLEEIEDNQRRARMIPYRRQDGTMDMFPAAKRGNSTYAYRTGKQLSVHKQMFLDGFVDYSVMFITLVVPHNNSYYGCQDTWKATAKAIGPFIKALKKKGVEKYFIVLEATSKGCCHTHLLTSWNRSLRASIQDGKFHLEEKDLLDFIKERWDREWTKVSDLLINNNSVAVQVCPNLKEAEKAFEYASKYLGERSNIMKSLDRAHQDKATSYDQGKLFTNYWASKTNRRVCRMSRNLSKGALYT